MSERVRRRIHWRVAAAVLGVLLGAAMLPSAHATGRSGVGFVLTGSVGLVRGPDSGPEAERVVRNMLARAGVTPVVATRGADPGTDVTIWLGGGDEALSDLGAKPATGLPAESYVLATGKDSHGHGVAVLDGVDADGTFYAAEDLSRLVVPLTGPDLVHAVSERESPSMRYRGVIEGFYGTPWSQDERLAMLDYLGAHRMNTYEYAPKDDPYHRQKWREPYPDARLADLGALVKRARDNRVDFVFALSPGLSICYSSAADYAALTAKFDSLYKLGVRSFAMPFDDIDPGVWHCAADKDKYGDAKGAEGRAQADLLNRVQRKWVAGKGDVAPLQMVPTEYDNVTESPYKKAIRERLDNHVLVHWTGVAVIPHKITRDQASQARTVFGHQIIVWDNYPVNDYIAGRLPLGPYTGREPGLSQEVTGVLSNPMTQSGPSKIGLFSMAEFGWNDESYDAWKSYDRALLEEAGGDARVATALGWFADLNYYDGTLHYERAPRLATAFADFWADWLDGNTTEAASGLRPTLTALVRAPEVVRSGVDDPAFTQQAKAWLDAAEVWAKAMVASLDTLIAMDGNEPATAWAKQEETRSLVAQAGEIRDSRSPHTTTAPLIGDGVVDRFVTEVGRRFDAAVGVGLDEVVAQTSLGTYDGKDATRMIDGDKGTAFVSDEAPRAGDYVQVDLRRVRPIGDVTVTMTDSGEPHDFLKAGTLEYSTNGSSWRLLAHGDTAEVRAHPPAGTEARYVRYRAASANAPYWLAVQEFKVALPNRMTLSVDGPDGADDVSASAAADDDLSSAYKPDGDATADGKLVVTLSRPRTVDKVTVLQQKSGGSGAQVEVRVDGTWTRVGALAGEFTQLPVDRTQKIDGVRLTWTTAGSAPSVAEIVPHYGAD